VVHTLEVKHLAVDSDGESAVVLVIDANDGALQSMQTIDSLK
jgi:hypothetical protein